MIGRTLSHYKILSEISRGGMGIVYRALDLKLDREVALKVLPPALVADSERKRRFVQEAKAAAKLEHPHIGVVHEIDEAEGVTFIAMELIEGEKLKDIISKDRLPLTRSLELATEVAEGLARAHDKGIVHRDLKPANIMITEDGHAKIIDFGLAKLVEPKEGEGSEVKTALRGETESGVIFGTVSYMSPEQARGHRADHRSDIFSFGTTFYEMLTSKPAQLIHAETDEHIWAKSYERELKDVLRLQREVARAIVEEIRIELTPQEERRLSDVEIIPATAYDAYLNRGMGHRFYYARMYDDAVNAELKVLKMSPSFVPALITLGHAYLQKGMLDEALSAFSKATSLTKGAGLDAPAVGYACAVAGRRDQALEILGEYKREEKRSYVSPYNIAAVYVGLNERDKALEYLEKAYEERTCALAFVKVEPLWDPIRPDPRFQDLLRRMNFPE